MSYLVIIPIINLVGLAILGYLYIRQAKIIKAIFPELPGQKEKASFVEALQQILTELEDLKKREVILNKNIANFSLESLENIQKHALYRYNPYGDTGGDQSFSICLLNGKETGILFTSLHTRAGTRIYAKNIIQSKPEIELSLEERQTLNIALGKQLQKGD